MRIGNHDTHPIADTFPLIEGPALASLIDDIKVNGLRNKIVLFQVRGHGSPDLILDGRNRYRACIAAKVEPEFIVYDGPEDDESLVRYVVSVNMERRDLTADQRALVVRRLTTHLARAIKADRKRAKYQPSLPATRSTEDDQLDQVLEDGVPELEAAVSAGEIDIDRASQIAELEPEQQRAVLARLAEPEKPEPVRAKKEATTVMMSIAKEIGPAEFAALKCALVVLDRNPHGEVRAGAEVMRAVFPWLPRVR